MMKTYSVVCCLALALLAGSPSPAAAQERFEDVVRNLRNPDAKIRVNAVRLLRESKHLEAITPIAPLVNDPVDEIQLEAIAAELAFYLVEDIPARRRVGFIVELRNPGRAPVAFDMGPLASWPRPVPVELTAALLKAIDDENQRVRVEAIYTLGVIGQPPLAPEHAQALIKALDHYDPVMRAGAARVIGRLKVTGAGDALLRAVNDSNAQVRYAAMRGLGEVGEVRAVQALTEQLTYYNKGEGAYAALDGLARIAHETSVPVFKARLADKDAFIRRAAMEGLGRAGDQSSISALEIPAGNDSAEMVRAAASFALQKLGKQTYITRMVESMDSEKMAPQIAAYFIELGPSIVPTLVPYLLDQDAVIRANVAIALGGIGGDAALAALQPLLNDADRTVVQAATRAIERIKIKG